MKVDKLNKVLLVALILSACSSGTSNFTSATGVDEFTMSIAAVVALTVMTNN
jgi:hypothetical protein